MGTSTGTAIVLLLLLVSPLKAAMEIISIPSGMMKKSFKACVITPSGYSPGDRYPAVYLLHGYSGNYSTWSRIAPLERYADTFRLIIVCPDGNCNSWYLDSPVRPNSLFESYITKEVVPFIDGHYNSLAEAKGRVIIGSSMGGHGALTLLAKRPDLFCGAGSISGIMDLAEFPGEWDLAGVLGPLSRNRDAWKSCSFIGMAAALKDKGRALLLDCGDSDFALPGNRRAHSLLLSRHIPHEYRERPGGHTLDYSARSIGFHLHYFSRLLLQPEKN
jgi:S-formylglutathione hydrolase FrmB